MEPNSGMPRTKARVPSIGSMVQRQRVPVPVKPSSSPRISIGPARVAAARRARITASASRSARVTGDPSALRSRPSRRLPKYPRMTGAARLRGLDRGLQQRLQLSFRHRNGRINDLSYDLLIIGGGIHGAGIARDAAGRGLSVLLVEKDSLARHTSSASSKLVHGGLRYLEYFHLRLVRESLMERERLLAIAPHLIERRRFVLPYRSRLRPAWAVRLGLFLYDWMGRRSMLGPSEGVRFAESPYGRPLRPALRFGFAYTDCTADDSRLVILNAKDAAERGADIRVGHRLVRAKREGKAWRAEIRDEAAARRTPLQHAPSSMPPDPGSARCCGTGSAPRARARFAS